MCKQNRQDETKNNCRGKRILDSILDCITFDLFWKKKEVKILGIHCYSKPQTPLALKARLQRMSVHTVSLAWQRPVETQSKSSFSQDISEVLSAGLLTPPALGRYTTGGYPGSMIWGVPWRLPAPISSPSFVVVAATAETVCVNSSLWWDSVGGRGFKTKRVGESVSASINLSSVSASGLSPRGCLPFPGAL